jgi:hypothetical protein
MQGPTGSAVGRNHIANGILPIALRAAGNMMQ